MNNTNGGNKNKNLTNGSSNNIAVVNDKCNLIVNYLPQSVKEQDFSELFTKIGPVRTCKLMFDKQTGYSFGYGFVEYQNPEDAQKAIDTLNGYQLEHKRLKVAFARPNSEDTKNTNLYVRNIPTTYDENSLNELFSQYGEVVQVRILRDQNTAFSRRIGFVIMSTKQMAQNAINGLDKQIPANATEQIHVKYADEEGKKRQAPRNNNNNNNNNNSNNNYYDTNSFSNSGLFNTFQSTNSLMQQNYGKMKSNHRGNNQNRYNPMSSNNFGYYSNTSQSPANAFDSLLNASTFNQYQQSTNDFNTHYNQNFSSSITASGQNFDQDKNGGHIIYVYGIGPHANESDLYTLFNNVGRILRVNVIKNQKSGLGKGYGFVVFETYEEACFAVQQINGFIFNNRPLQVQLHTSQMKS